MSKRHTNEFLRTGTGRLAGSGILHDNYSEESFPGRRNTGSGNPAFIAEREEWEEGPVTTYRLTEEELKELNKRIEQAKGNE